MKRLLPLALIIIVSCTTTTSEEDCETEEFGYIELTNNYMVAVGVQITIINEYDIEEKLSEITIPSKTVEKIQCPEGLVQLLIEDVNFEPYGGFLQSKYYDMVDAGLLNRCETYSYTCEEPYCDSCRAVRIDVETNNRVFEFPYEEYCEEELDEILNTPPFTLLNGNVELYECQVNQVLDLK